MKKLYYLLLIVLPFFLGCEKENQVSNLDFGYDYFPVDSGIERIYRVDSLYWDAFNQGLHDTISYEIKDVNTGFFMDIQGRKTQRIERYRKDINFSNWQLWYVYTQNITNSTAETVINNERVISLAFKLANGVKWNGNSYNTNGEQQFEIVSFNEPMDLEGQYYESTTNVLQKEDWNAIQEIYSEEIYAKNVGKIYKRDKNIHTTFGMLITGGYDYRETLISFTPAP